MDSLYPPLPAKVTIDVCSACNLACPMCPTGARTTQMSIGLISPTEFRRYLDQFPQLNRVSLYHLGEPFLNKHIFEILAICAERKLETRIDSHFSLNMDDEFLRRILHSGLERLQASIDGASQKTYEAYRIKGNFDLAFNNLRRMRALQKQEGLDSPRLVWKFLVNRFNEAEIDQAKRMAAEIDVELDIAFFGLVDDCPDADLTNGKSLGELKKYWLPEKEEHVLPHYREGYHKPYFYEEKCHWLFDSLVVHTNGDVMPCCYLASARSAFGNLNSQPIEAIWNSPQYQYARSLFLEDTAVPRVPVPCETCPIYRHRRSSGPSCQ